MALSPITLTPGTPLTVSQTISTTFNSFQIVSLEIDLPEQSVIIGVNKTDSNGVITTDSITLTGADAASFLGTAASAGETLQALGISTAVAAVETHYGLSNTTVTGGT